MAAGSQLTTAIQVFYSYSHKDEKLRDTLEEHLSLLKRQGIIGNWHDRNIGAGREWSGEIDEHLKTADLILLLVSASFIASDYCYGVELTLALERHTAGDARVIPVILRPCDWTTAPFGKLQALPKNGRPVTKWTHKDDAFTDIANGIRRAAGEIAAERRADKAAPVRARATADAPAANAEGHTASLIPRPPVVGFVARRDEQGRDIVGLLKEELAPEKGRLVSLWGPGGAGKTTLAAEVVRGTEDIFHGRIVWASSLRRADFNLATLLDEVATQLGREDLRKLAPGPKAAGVAALVAAQSTLVVLDNFETIPAEEQARCLDFLAQSAACPALITTRSFIDRDDVYNVPLAAMSMEEARDFLQRLVERTRRPSNFDKLDRDDLIRRCEANPLVLQWVVRQIDLAKRPQDVLNDLTHGEGDAAERVFTRSFNLPQVGQDGRDALLALSLFTPNASREALAEVAGFGDDTRRLDRAVEALSSLWLVESTEGNERLFLRGLSRELAKSRLLKNEGADAFRRRYVAHFLLYAQTHAQPTPENLDSLEAEKDNLLGAMDAAFDMGDWEDVMGLRLAVDKFLSVRGYWDRAVRSGEQAQTAAHKAGSERDAAHFMMCVARIRSNRGEYAEAERMYRELLETFRRFGSEINVAACLHQLGMISQFRGELKEAGRLYAESLEIERSLDNQSGIAVSLHQLGRLAKMQGELEEARQLYAESLQIHESLGDQVNIANNLHELGAVAEEQGDLVEARRLYCKSLDIEQKHGHQHGIALSLGTLGLLAEKEGDKVEAARLLREALSIFEQLGSPWAEVARKDVARLEGEADLSHIEERASPA